MATATITDGTLDIPEGETYGWSIPSMIGDTADFQVEYSPNENISKTALPNINDYLDANGNVIEGEFNSSAAPGTNPFTPIHSLRYYAYNRNQEL